MTNDVKKQVSDLVVQAQFFANAHGEELVLLFQEKCGPLLEWISFLQNAQRTGVADSLLDGALSSIREAAACLSMGLVRPALFSLRTQIDLVLAWLYFKDHGIEWQSVNDFGDGYKQKREILEYLNTHFKGFSARYGYLKEVATRTVEEPYRLLSAHIHAQSGAVLPAAAALKDVVCSRDLCIEYPALTSDVCEYLGDVLACVYVGKWAAVPTPVRTSIENRLRSKKGLKERFFEGL